jgi:hypothetical protein
MRGRLRWVTIVVAASAIVGGAAAIINTPVSTSSASSVTQTTSTPRDVVTPEINYLASQAQQLGSEIASAQAELSHLQQQVAYEASLSHFHVAVPVVTQKVTHRVGAAPTTTTTKANATTTTVSPSTTSTSTTLAPTTTSTICPKYQGDNTSANTTNCSGQRHDN